MAIVLAVGPGRTYPNGVTVPLEIKPGDKIYIANLGRCEVVKNDEDRYLFMVPEPLVEGIIEEDEEDAGNQENGDNSGTDDAGNTGSTSSEQ